MDQPTNDGVNTYFVSKAARAGRPHRRALRARRRRGVLGLPALPVARRRVAAGWRGARRRRARRWRGRRGLWGRVRGRDNWMRMAFLDDGAIQPGAVSAAARLLSAAARDAAAGDRPTASSTVAVEQHFDGLRPGAGDDAGAAGFNYLEFKRYLHDQLLRDTDVFSMAHSIEVRVPFLDHPLVEYAAGAPARAEDRRTGSTSRCWLAPSTIRCCCQPAAAKKRGFSFPMDRWMKDVGRRAGRDGHVGQRAQSALRSATCGKTSAAIGFTGRAPGR